MLTHRRRRIGQRLAYGCLALFGVALVGAFMLQSLMEARLAALRAQLGEPQALAEYKARVAEHAAPASAPAASPAPEASGLQPSEDPYLAVTTAVYAAVGAWRETRPEVIIRTGHFDTSTQDWQNMVAFLADNPDLLRQIYDLATSGRVPVIQILPAENLWHQNFSVIRELISAAGLLLADACLKSEAGNTADAVDEIVAVLRMANALAEVPLGDALATRRNIHWQFDTVLQRTVPPGQLSREEAEALLGVLATAHHREHWRDSTESELSAYLQSFDDLLSMDAHEFLLRYSPGDSGQIGPNVAIGLARSPFISPMVMHVESRLVEGWQRIREVSELPNAEAHAALDEFRASLSVFGPWNAGNGVLQGFVIGLEQQYEHEARVDLTRIGIAVELYHTENGVYPATLDEVRDLLGGDVPVDSVTGAPFTYTPTDDGFTLFGSECRW